MSAAPAVRDEPAIRLFPRQMRFVKSAAPFPSFIGGIGSGKSFSGAVKVLARIGRKELGMVCAPAYPMLRDATQRTVFALLHDAGIPYVMHKSENRITIPGSGHEILFRSLDDPEAVRGPNLDYAWIDEASLVTKEAWQIVKGRVRVGVHPQVWITATPKGRNWLYEAYEVNATGNEFDPTHPLYRVRTDENPELPPGFGGSLGYTGRFALQELGGEFVAFEGVVYPGFSRQQVQRIDCEKWSTILALDVGTRNPTALLTIRHAGDRIHVERELYRRGMGSGDIVAATAEEATASKATHAVVDPSSAGLILDLRGRGVKAVKADNTVIEGISRVTSALPDLTVDPSCVNLIAEFESYAYPDGARGEKDAPVKANDHALDALRYAIMDLTGPRPSGRVWFAGGDDG